MSIPFRCGFCSKRHLAVDRAAGLRLPCRRCGRTLRVPALPPPLPAGVALPPVTPAPAAEGPLEADFAALRAADKLRWLVVVGGACAALALLVAAATVVIARGLPPFRAAAADPAPPEDEPAPGRVLVTTEPAGARVRVDGKEVGAAPVEALLRGRESVVAALAGHDEASLTYDPARDPRSVRLTLRPRPAVIALKLLPPDAAVVVSGGGATVTAVEGGKRITVAIPDPARPLAVRVSRVGYRPAEVALAARPGEADSVTVSLEPLPAERKGPGDDTLLNVAPPLTVPVQGAVTPAERLAKFRGRLEGTWEIDSITTENNVSVTLGSGPPPALVFRVTGTGGSCTVRSESDTPASRYFLSLLPLPTYSRFTLDAGGDAVAIDFFPVRGNKLYAIAKLEGRDKLVICVSTFARPDKFTPAREPSGERLAVVTLKRNR